MKQQNSSPFLALLIGAPHAGDVAMYNDVVAMYNALCRRGVPPESILSFVGRLNRRLLVEMFAYVRGEVNRSTVGEVLIAVSGHGYFIGEEGATAQIGLELRSADQPSPETHLLWDELFAELALPSSVRLTLVPDH